MVTRPHHQISEDVIQLVLRRQMMMQQKILWVILISFLQKSPITLGIKTIAKNTSLLYLISLDYTSFILNNVRKKMDDKYMVKVFCTDIFLKQSSICSSGTQKATLVVSVMLGRDRQSTKKIMNFLLRHKHQTEQLLPLTKNCATLLWILNKPCRYQSYLHQKRFTCVKCGSITLTSIALPIRDISHFFYLELETLRIGEVMKLVAVCCDFVSYSKRSILILHT